MDVARVDDMIAVLFWEVLKLSSKAVVVMAAALAAVLATEVAMRRWSTGPRPDGRRLLPFSLPGRRGGHPPSDQPPGP